MRWCDVKGWESEANGGITPCFTQSIFALGPILFLCISGPYHYHYLRSTPDRAVIMDSRKRLVDPLYWPKVVFSLIMSMAPVATIATVLAIQSTDQYSIAFFLAHSLRAVSWALSLVLVVLEDASLELTYNSWVVLSWWVLNLISNSVFLVTSGGFSASDPSVLSNSILSSVQFFANAALVLFGFLVPKHLEDLAPPTTSTEVSPLLNAAAGLVVEGSAIQQPVRSPRSPLGASFSQSSRGGSSWWSSLWPWARQQRRRRRGRYSALSDSLVHNDYTGASGASWGGGETAPLGTPSVVSRQDGGRRNRNSYFNTFLRGRQPFAAPERSSYASGEEAASFTTRGGSSLHLTKEWSGPSGRGSRHGQGRVYTVSIPRWVLVDEEGEVVEIDSLIEGEMYEDRVLDEEAKQREHDIQATAQQLHGGAQEDFPGLERRPTDLSANLEHVQEDRSSSVPDLAGTKVGFEVMLKAEEEEGGEEGRYPTTHSIVHSYDDFEALHSALVVRFGPEGTTGLKPPSVKGRQGGVLRVADVSADMRALSAFLRNILALRLTCPELTAFLFPDGLGEEEEDDDELVLGGEEEKGAGEGGGAAGQEAAEEEEEDFLGISPGENKGAEEMELMAELRRVVCAMREDVPVGERQIRLRTFHDVVGGNEIYRWLRDNVDDCGTKAETLDKGAALVAHGLLIPIVTGYATDQPEEEDEDDEAAFCDSRVWLFRYGDRCGRRPVHHDDPSLVSILAHPIKFQIPRWSEAADPTPRTSSEMHITFDIVVTTQVDGWTVHRRYSDFTKLHKRLKRLGILPPNPLPPRRAAGGKQHEDEEECAFLDDRRKGLELYLLTVIAAAQESPSVLGKTVMNFLDSDALSLNVRSVSSPHADEDGEEDEDEEEEEDKVAGMPYRRRSASQESAKSIRSRQG